LQAAAAGAGAERASGSAGVLDMLLSELHSLCGAHHAGGRKGRELRDWVEAALAALREPLVAAVRLSTPSLCRPLSHALTSD
jgi:hypothetical protein